VSVLPAERKFGSIETPLFDLPGQAILADYSVNVMHFRCDQLLATHNRTGGQFAQASNFGKPQCPQCISGKFVQLSSAFGEPFWNQNRVLFDLLFLCLSVSY
jgi:hypothetical protein